MKLGIHNKDDIEFVTAFPCLLGHIKRYILQTKRKENTYKIYGNHEKLRNGLSPVAGLNFPIDKKK